LSFCLFLFLWFFNLKPLQANADFIKILSATSNASFDALISSFEEVIDRNTYGNQEYRRHYFNFYERAYLNLLGNSEKRTPESEERMAKFSDLMEKNIFNQLQENPYSIANYLMALRFYNLSYVFNPNRFDNAFKSIEKAKQLSSGRPQVYYEAATTYYYYANYLIGSGKKEEAKEYLAKTVDYFFQGVEKNFSSQRSLDESVGFFTSIKNNNGELLIEVVYSSYPELPLRIAKRLLSDLEVVKLQKSEEEFQSYEDNIREVIKWLASGSDNGDFTEILDSFK
jgi:tetratricopeptide (TPR) repeat protein